MREHSFDDFFAELMQDPNFRREWENGKPELDAMCADIEHRIAAEKQAKKQNYAAQNVAVA